MARTTYTHYIALLQRVSTGHVDGVRGMEFPAKSGLPEWRPDQSRTTHL